MFSAQEQSILVDALCAAATEFEYRLSDAVVEPTHLHWILGHDDEVPTMVARLKNRMRQRLRRGRIWTAGFSHRLLFDDRAVSQVREYLTKHQGLRLLAGSIIEFTH